MTITYPARYPAASRTPDWRATAVCRGAENDAWFPHPTNALAVQAAKQGCFACPVMFHCAQTALVQRIDDGVWGGLSEKQRNSITSQNRADTLHDISVVRAAVLHALRHELNPTQSLRDIWEQRTYEMAGGHIGWRGESTTFSFKGHSYTPKQVSFFLDRGHKAAGVVRRIPECLVVECVNPRHLLDNTERHLRKRAEQEAAARAEAQAAVEEEAA